MLSLNKRGSFLLLLLLYLPHVVAIVTPTTTAPLLPTSQILLLLLGGGHLQPGFLIKLLPLQPQPLLETTPLWDAVHPAAGGTTIQATPLVE